MMDDDVVIDIFVQQCCATMYTTVNLLLCYKTWDHTCFNLQYRQSLSQHVVVFFTNSFSSPSSMVMVAHDTTAFCPYYS